MQPASLPASQPANNDSNNRTPAPTSQQHQQNHKKKKERNRFQLNMQFLNDTQRARHTEPPTHERGLGGKLFFGNFFK